MTLYQRVSPEKGVTGKNFFEKSFSPPLPIHSIQARLEDDRRGGGDAKTLRSDLIHRVPRHIQHKARTR